MCLKHLQVRSLIWLIEAGRRIDGVGKLTLIGSDNVLSPGRREAIVGTNAGILLIGTWGTNFREILSEIHIFHSRISIWKCRLEDGGQFVSASMC